MKEQLINSVNNHPMSKNGQVVMSVAGKVASRVFIAKAVREHARVIAELERIKKSSVNR